MEFTRDNLYSAINEDSKTLNLIDEYMYKIDELYCKLEGNDKPEFKPFLFAYLSYLRLLETTEKIKNKRYLTVVDFTKPNTSKRFYVIDMQDGPKVIHSVRVWHGHGIQKRDWSYEVWIIPTPESFSNDDWSNKSSLWSFITSDELESNQKGTWQWLLMTWLEESNYHASSRRIFIHPGWVDRSEWCFTLPDNEVWVILDELKWWSFVFSYYDDLDYIYDSWILNPTIANIIHDKLKIGLHAWKMKIKNAWSKVKSGLFRVLWMKK